MNDIVYVYDTLKSPRKGSKIWTSKEGKDFEESYCSSCEVDSLLCPSCGLGSCSGGGCDYCKNAFKEYLNE